MVRALNPEQVVRVEKLYTGGMGYKKISIEVGAKRDQVRDYLRWNGFTSERNSKYVKEVV